MNVNYDNMNKLYESFTLVFVSFFLIITGTITAGTPEFNRRMGRHIGIFAHMIS